jgi:hypothetical protein
MHTSVETIHLDDVMHLAELLSAFAASLTAEDADTFQGETFFRGGARTPLSKPREKAKAFRPAKRAPSKRTPPRVKRAAAKRAAVQSSRRAKPRAARGKRRR